MSTTAENADMSEPALRPEALSPSAAAAVPETRAASPDRPSGFAAAWMLARREWVRFFRQKNRVVSAVIQPLLFWVLFGTGLRGSFEGAGEQGFLEYFLPGTVALIVLFTAIFATISVIEDRREGFMQAVLVAPVGRWPILLGKILGGAAIAWVQAIVFLALAYAFGTIEPAWTFLPLLGLLAILALSMCALGMIVAWPMDSTQGFHAVMMLGLMPMWLLSGAFFPIPALGPEATIGQVALSWVMRLNPLSYTLAEMRRLLYPAVDFASRGWAPTPTLAWAVSVGFLVVTFLLAAYLMRGSRKADLVV
ncbi:ABC transporter permease [Candidatus Laterigemmans baculatus]|uniref:ABC transporter permease n=1 Tax=Candidatus Laterigemmans baculatus TaxID=2770505 RepID=UPI001F2C5AFC|nr:ABC transporter permease [Candidatus Laterigemmans baculatus]